MYRHLKAYLFDIQVAIDEIYSFFDSVPKQFEEYRRNLMLRRAIENETFPSSARWSIELSRNILTSQSQMPGL